MNVDPLRRSDLPPGERSWKGAHSRDALPAIHLPPFADYLKQARKRRNPGEGTSGDRTSPEPPGTSEYTISVLAGLLWRTGRF